MLRQPVLVGDVVAYELAVGHLNGQILIAVGAAEDELKIGDVILYTWIDGKCYVSHPEVDVK